MIASESSNNAKEGGALVPTVAFGVPGSATMAILLGAFLIHGLVPGPDMLHKNLDITYAMVWSVALANILGAGACYAFSPQFARLATLRYTLILPAVLSIVYIGAFEASRSWGDLFALLLFGVFGWLMKQFKWPRPPLVLGLVLGDSIERYMFISIERYELLLADAAGGGDPAADGNRRCGAAVPGRRAPAGRHRQAPDELPGADVQAAAPVHDVLHRGDRSCSRHALPWAFAAKLVPMIVGTIALTVAGVSLFNELCRKPTAAVGGSLIDEAQAEVAQTIHADEKIHMDLESDTGHLPIRTIVTRAARFFGYLVAFMASMALIGLIPTASFSSSSS